MRRACQRHNHDTTPLGDGATLAASTLHPTLGAAELTPATGPAAVTAAASLPAYPTRIPPSSAHAATASVATGTTSPTASAACAAAAATRTRVHLLGFVPQGDFH